ncbi:class I SAM-dependent methyltransferase [Marivirga sp. S37H4]|uniref:Class I SAM-dependent methyltransferase n=1 Tax=Marivirga aurantiaca TaxID=2802615 RepID=A0A934X0D0_9BACT|nr:class I SAM-dependent methyltransferase [Marivirga aurantiaca]MBK6266588.1 class I SAM-dependent methyltransferase [Marivirga aurantiaca]
MAIQADDMKTIATQLRCPSGEDGLEIAGEMNKTNHGMTMNTIRHLDLKGHDRVLEIGPGNAQHLVELMKMAPEINYNGLDISADMKKEAERINADFVRKKQAQFFHYSGESFPFEDKTFDKIMTVNTLYFWEDPAATLQEIYRVLKPGGLCNITYSLKDFMKNLPFTVYGFQLYNDEDVLALIEKSSFNDSQIIPEIETVKSKHGEMVNRTYSVLIVRK